MKRLYVAAGLAVLPLLSLALFPLLVHGCDQEIAHVTEQELIGTYVFERQPPNTTLKECITLYSDGSYSGAGLHATESIVKASGRWHIDETPYGTLVSFGDFGAAITTTRSGVVFIHLGENQRGNRCIKRR